MSFGPDAEQMLIIFGIAEACATGSRPPNPTSASQAAGATAGSLDRIAEPARSRLAIGIEGRCHHPGIWKSTPA